MLLLVALLSGSPIAVPPLKPCVPKAPKALIAIGQDAESIGTYATVFGSPAVVSSYTAIDTLHGLTSAVDYGGGVQHAEALLQQFPGASLLLAVYAVGQLTNITKGRLDHRIDELGGWILRARVPVYVRFAYEFDNPSNKYDPVAFVDAFRYFVMRLREANVPNVAHVWHSWGFEPAGGRDALEWFPGVEYVDWVGLSAFQQFLPPELCPAASLCETKHMDAVAALAKAHGLPLMICEAAPFGGIRPTPLRTAAPAPAAPGSSAAAGSPPPPAPPMPPAPKGKTKDTWGGWFTPLLGFMRTHDVRLLAYIDCDWDRQPMWKGGGWGDTRIEAEPRHRRLWRNRVLSRPHFKVNANNCEAGTTTAMARPPLAPDGSELSPQQPIGAAVPGALRAPSSPAADDSLAKAAVQARASKAKAVWVSLAAVGVIGLGALAYAQRSMLGIAPSRRTPRDEALLAGEHAGAAAGAVAGR